MSKTLKNKMAVKSLYCDVFGVDPHPELIRVVLKKLKERDRVAIINRYGLDCEPKTLSEVGKILGVGTERVRMLLARGIRALRSPNNRRYFERFNRFHEDENDKYFYLLDGGGYNCL